MKCFEIFEGIYQHTTTGKVFGSISQWLKDNNVSVEQIDQAVALAKKSDSFKYLESFYRPGKVQKNRGTIVFKVTFPLPGNKKQTRQYLVWPNGKIRTAEHDGMKQTVLKSDFDIIDIVNLKGDDVVKAMATNLINGIKKIERIVKDKHIRNDKFETHKNDVIFEQPDGIFINFNNEQWNAVTLSSILQYSKDSSFKYEFYKPWNKTIQITFNSEFEFPGNLIKWTKGPNNLILQSDKEIKNFSNLPSSVEYLFLKIPNKKIDAGEILKAFPKLSSLQIENEATINLVKLAKKEVAVNFANYFKMPPKQKELTTIYFKYMRDTDNKSPLERSLALQEWLIENNFEEFAE